MAREREETYKQIVEDLRERIDGGEIAEGVAVDSENALAARYGVGRSQARRALTELEVRGYILRSQGRRSVAAPAHHRNASLPSGGPTTFALALPEYKARHMLDLMHGFMEEITREGHQSVIYSIRETAEREAEFLKTIRSAKIGGFALYLDHVQANTCRLLHELHAANYPFVLVDRYVEGLDVDSVVTDNMRLGRELTAALLARGHKRVVFAGNTFHLTSVRDRLAGYRAALGEAGHPAPEELVAETPFPLSEALLAELHRVLALRERPTAFLCLHDGLASQIATELRQLGYRIPEDIELAATNDNHFAAEMGIPMIVAEQPSYETGREAARLVIARAEQPDRPTEKLVLAAETPHEEQTCPVADEAVSAAQA